MWTQRLSRRYVALTFAWVAAFLILLVLAVLWSHRYAPGSPIRIALGLLPALAAVGGILLDLQLTREFDELQRRIYFESLLVGTYASMALCLIAWTLEQFAELPRIEPIYIFMTFAFTSLVANLWIGWRYR